MSDFTIEHGHAEYSDAELLEQARNNAQALILATVAFLEERGVPPAEWAAAIGETFARGWGDPRPWDAGEFLDAMLTNLRALGAEVKEAQLGVDQLKRRRPASPIESSAPSSESIPCTPPWSTTRPPRSPLPAVYVGHGRWRPTASLVSSSSG